MATDPMQAQAAPSPDDAGMAQGGAETAQGGFVIEIAVDAQGGITVSSEPASDEASEESGAPQGEASEPQGQPVGSIKEALSAALAIYKNQGQMNSPAADEQAGFDQAMTDGAQGRGGYGS